MPITRIYQNCTLKRGEHIPLDQQAYQHIVQSLRIKTGEDLILFNGQGGEYRAKIHQIQRRAITVEVCEFNAIERESALKIHLGQAIIHASKMDLIIQKAVELGVTSMTPIITARLATKLPPDRMQKRLERWHNIIISACEQCGRNRLPQLHEPMTLQQWLPSTYNATRLLLHPADGVSLTSTPVINKEIDLLIGPEGGLLDEEVVLAEQHGFQSIHLGQRILRAETATIAALSVLQHHWGDLKP